MSCVLSLESSYAAERMPSLFRGVVVADSPLGVRVISVEDGSPAHAADVRPEDLIVRVNDTDVHSIDEFATLSSALRGRAMHATVVTLRRGQPRRVTVHLYSHPVLRAWGLTFVPEHDIRFAQASVGVAHWMRMGRGFEEARKPEEALNAYLNALHNEPTNLDAAMKVAELLWRVARHHLQAKRLPQAVASLQQATTFLEKLFSYPLEDDKLQLLQHQLDGTVQLIRSQQVKKP